MYLQNIVWPQSFKAQSSGQPSWQTQANKQTHTQGENIITFAFEGDEYIHDSQSICPIEVLFSIITTEHVMDFCIFVARK